MPGKVNPVIPRGGRCRSAAQVIGNDAAVAFAGAPGNFELNVMLPVMARNAARVDPAARQRRRRLLADRCVDGLEADDGRAAARYAESSPSIVTPLNRYIGYEEAAKIAKQVARGAA